MESGQDKKLQSPGAILAFAFNAPQIGVVADLRSESLSAEFETNI